MSKKSKHFKQKLTSSNSIETQGILYLIPTPIGNLEDITFRAKKILKEVDLIFAEDTRSGSILKREIGFTAPMKSFFAAKENSLTQYIINELSVGKKIAIISEVGTFAISDPGGLILYRVIEQGYRVEVLPGPVAFIPALIQSGLKIHPFLFYGFIPSSPKNRRRVLRELVHIEHTLVFYESPHRIAQTLKDCIAILGNRKASLSREISKIYEEHIRGDIQSILDDITSNPRKGEMVLVIGGNENRLQNSEEK